MLIVWIFLNCFLFLNCLFRVCCVCCCVCCGVLRVLFCAFSPPSAGPPPPDNPLPDRPSSGPPKISLFFLPLPPHFCSFCLSLGVFSLNFGSFCEDQDPQMCTFGLSGCRVKPRRPTFSATLRRGPHPFGPHFFWVWPPTLRGPQPFVAAQIVTPPKHEFGPKMDWPKTDWPKTDWPKTDWPKTGWPKMDLAKNGRAQNTMAKNGLARRFGAAGASSDSPRAQTCTLQGPGASNTTKIPRKDTQEREEKKENCGRRGKKSEIFGGPGKGARGRGGPGKGGPGGTEHDQTKTLKPTHT